MDAREERALEQLRFGLQLEKARESKGLTKTAACKQVGVSRMTYVSWESGHWVPALDHAEVIAEFTGQPRIDVLSALMRLNGLIGPDEVLELHDRHRHEAGFPPDTPDGASDAVT